MLMYSEYLVKQSLDLQKILCISYFEPDFKCEKSKLSIITEVHNIFKLSAFLDTSPKRLSMTLFSLNSFAVFI